MTHRLDSEPTPPLQRETLAQPRLSPHARTFAFATAVAGVAGLAVGALVTVVERAQPAPRRLALVDSCPAVATPTRIQAAPPSLILEPALVEPPPEARGLDGALVVQADGPRVVLGHVAQGYLVGTPTLVTVDEGLEHAVRHPVDRESLPGEWSALVGSTLELYGKSGPVCQARVTGLAAFGHWIGEIYEEDSASAWDAVSDSGRIVAEIEPVRGDCSSARWARDASRPAAEVADVHDAREPVRARALQEFRKLRAHRNIQRAFEKETGERMPWDRYQDGEVEIHELVGTSERIVTAAVRVGGCGDFEGTLNAAWRLGPSGDWVPLAVDDGAALAEIEAAADMDGDGFLDLVTKGYWADRALRRSGDDGYQIDSEDVAPIHMCTC